MPWLRFLPALLIAGSAAAAANAATTPPPPEIIACVNRTTFQVRIVSKATLCTTSERALKWNVEGPVGPIGPRGLHGVIGPEGPKGAAGVRGATGLQGPTGARGATGAAGALGLTGSTGAVGAQGPGGFNGAQLFTANGTWTAPPTITHVMVELVGGGGSGFGPLLDETGGGQGGGGAYTKTLVPVTPGAVYTVAVGVALQAGAGVPLPGLPSVFEDSAQNGLAVAAGGNGGAMGTGGAGGAADANTADLFASPGLPGANGLSVNLNGVQLVPNGQDFGEGGAGAASGAGSTGANGAVLLTW